MAAYLVEVAVANLVDASGQKVGRVAECWVSNIEGFK